MTATTIHNKLPAKASDGRCPSDSLSFLSPTSMEPSSSLMSLAWSPASYRTLIASYMIITVNHITIANKSSWIPYLRANAVASDTTTDEWTEGIPPLHRDLSKFHFQEAALITSPFISTDNTNVTAGTRISVS